MRWLWTFTDGFRSFRDFDGKNRIARDVGLGYSCGNKARERIMAGTFEMTATNKTSDGERWDAVLARDRRADGSFVYAVDSTGVYCRPSCPSRRPRREHAGFFALPELAEVAGYRPCKRCRPDLADLDDPDVQLARRACRYLQQVDGDIPRLADLAAVLDTTSGRLQRAFTRVVGVTPRQFADACRVRGFKEQLRDGIDVTTALHAAGYGSSSRVYEHASDRLGMTPGAYRQRGRGMRIAAAITDSSLGRLLVARTERGICAVYLGDADAALEEALQTEYPAAEIAWDKTTLGPWVTAVLGRLSGKEPRQALPVDVQATAFQRQVWDALLRIPAGETRTYREIAESLGKPRAARAVGRACATNPVSVVIPCHRAVRGDGGLGGYRWGLERKQALLEREKATKRNSPAHPELAYRTGRHVEG